MKRIDRFSILVVDDQEEIAEICEDVLGDEMGHHVERIRNPNKAVGMVRDQLFDVVLIDSKMIYKRARKGGLLLAEEVGGLLGTDSVILMSQFEVREEVLELNPKSTFLAKPKGDKSPHDWVTKDLLGQISRLFDRQYGFVVMSYNDPKCDEFYANGLVPWMEEAGMMIKRMDEMPGPRAINTELQERIRQAHFVVIYASEKNPNVYFEAGYAAALEKFSVVCAEDIENLPFDIRSHHALVVGKDRDKEREEFTKLMRVLRGVL